MKIFFAFALTAAVSSFLIKDYDHRFLEYLAEHGKSYDTMEEYELRKEQFTSTHSFIIAHNSDATRTFKLAHNHMSDWTETERSRVYQTRREKPETSPVYIDSDETLLDDFDVSELNETLDENLGLEDIDETSEKYLDFDEIVQNENEYFDFAELDDAFDLADDLVKGTIGSNFEEQKNILTDDVFSAAQRYSRSNKRPKPLKRTQPAYEFKFDSPFSWLQTPVKGPGTTETSFVPSVRDQGLCGSCWAFAAVSALSSAWFIKKEDKLYRLSTQQLVDCAYFKRYSSLDSCQKGGNAFVAFSYYQKNSAILEVFYKYKSGETDKQGNCRTKFNYQNQAPVRTLPTAAYTSLPKDNSYGEGVKSNTIKQYLAVQPLVTTINVYAKEFNNWGKGLLDSKACGTGGHQVVLVGWGKTTQGIEYWIVQNSHGKGWGSNGYFFVPIDDGIQIDTVTYTGLCGIQEDVYFPNV